MQRTLLSMALSLSCFVATSAFAADGYVTGNVNLRAGPDVSYPSVDMLPAGTSVAIFGCVDGWSWCDVANGNDRGWVAGSFLQEEYQGRRVYIPEYGVRIGIPIVGFVFGTYWADHYHNRSWYGSRDHWSHIQPHYRPIVRHDEYHGNSHDYSHTSHTPSQPSNHGSRPAEYTVAPAHQQQRGPTLTVNHNAVAHPVPHNAATHPAPKQTPHGHPNDDHKDHKDNGH